MTAHEDDSIHGEVLKHIIGITFLRAPHRGSNSANLSSGVGTN